jgi:fucose 4-O-acetylase-like acetyltransferase
MRINEIDILKGLLIVLVVLGHSDFEYTREIYWFHMPAFFMISGFLFSSKNVTLELLPFLKKKILSLIIPYFTFLICFSIVSFALLDKSLLSANFLAKLIFGGKLLVNQFGVFWFITSLLFAFLFFTFLYNKIKNRRLLFLVITTCFVIAHIESYLIHKSKFDIYFPLNIDTSLMGVVYFYLGFMFKPHYQHFKATVTHHRYVGFIFTVLLVLAIFLVVEDFNFDMKYQSYGNVIYSLIIPVSITLVLLFFSIILSNIDFVKKNLVLIGKYSLLIMYLHLMIKYLLLKYECYNLSLFIILSILIPILLSKIFERNKYTSFLFLGDNSKLKL